MEKIKQVSPAINGRPIKNEDFNLFLAGIVNLAEMVKNLIGTTNAVPLVGAVVTEEPANIVSITEGILYQDGKFIYTAGFQSVNKSFLSYKLASENSRVYKDGIARDSIVFYEMVNEYIVNAQISLSADSNVSKLANTLSNASLNGRLAKYSEVSHPYKGKVVCFLHIDYNLGENIWFHAKQPAYPVGEGLGAIKLSLSNKVFTIDFPIAGDYKVDFSRALRSGSDVRTFYKSSADSKATIDLTDETINISIAFITVTAL